jgi:bacterioferritin
MTGTALTDINTLRKRARQHIEEGAVTSGYGADREAVLKMLNADRIAERIVQLRGQPDFSPDGVAARSHAEYVEGTPLEDLIQEDLITERIAIESYREMVSYLADEDPTTRRMLEDILASEEEHADDPSSLPETLPG